MMFNGFLKGLSPRFLYELPSRLKTHLRRSNPEELGEKDAAWYDRYYSQFRGKREHYSKSEYYFLWAVIADRMVRAGTRSILEIGCGRGRMATLLRDKGFTEYTGFDFSAEQIGVARQDCPEFRFEVANAFDTDLYDRCFYDTTICTEILEHVRDDIEILRKIRPGTRFYGSVPNFPFVSHVRCFADEKEVAERYGAFFRNFQIDTFPLKPGKIIYILSGVKI